VAQIAVVVRIGLRAKPGKREIPSTRFACSGQALRFAWAFSLMKPGSAQDDARQSLTYSFKRDMNGPPLQRPDSISIAQIKHDGQVLQREHGDSAVGSYARAAALGGQVDVLPGGGMRSKQELIEVR
jgi:hypothetical protein